MLSCSHGNTAQTDGEIRSQMLLGSHEVWVLVQPKLLFPSLSTLLVWQPLLNHYLRTRALEKVCDVGHLHLMHS